MSDAPKGQLRSLLPERPARLKLTTGEDDLELELPPNDTGWAVLSLNNPEVFEGGSIALDEERMILMVDKMTEILAYFRKLRKAT